MKDIAGRIGPGWLMRYQMFEGYPAQPKGFSHWYRFPPRQGPVRLAIDEWGLWSGGQGGRTNGWGVEQTYTWQEALTVAGWLNAMHRHANVIGFATWAQMVTPPTSGLLGGRWCISIRSRPNRV